MKMYKAVEQEVNQIRLRIYEETKDMTPAQCIERRRKKVEALARKYGFNFRFVSRAKEKADSAV